MVGVRGGRTHIEWTGALDGQDYALQGVDYVLTNAYRLIDERRYEIAVKVDGRMVAERPPLPPCATPPDFGSDAP